MKTITFKSFVLLISVLVISPLFFVFQINSAYACSCVARDYSVKEALKDAAAVFSGEVTSIKKSAVQHRVTFEVATAWKGVTKNPVTISTGADSAGCGYNFAKGESYLVFAYADPATNELSTTLCSKTALLSEATKDMTKLGTGTAIDPTPIRYSRPFFIALVSLGGVLIVGGSLSFMTKKKRKGKKK